MDRKKIGNVKLNETYSVKLSNLKPKTVSISLALNFQMIGMNTYEILLGIFREVRLLQFYCIIAQQLHSM